MPGLTHDKSSELLTAVSAWINYTKVFLEFSAEHFLNKMKMCHLFPTPPFNSLLVEVPEQEK